MTLPHTDRHSWLAHLLLSVPASSPWAILLVCFEDDPANLPPTGHYKQLFTDAGSGTMNMVDCFADMSHGHLDLSGSAVFGWYRLPAKRANYVGNVYPQPAGKLNRQGLLDLAKATAAAAGVHLTGYEGVCVSALGSVDCCGWLGGMAALCDSNSLTPSVLAQEMGHGYGLDHARKEGSTEDYQDPWDVMSTQVWPSMEDDNANYIKVGPGLNAWNMRSRGWLEEWRVYTVDVTTTSDVTIELRPLHDRSLKGYLAAELGPYLVEMRLPEKWDAAIPRACVLVHRFEDNHSYLQRAVGGNQELVDGDRFVVGSASSPFASYYELEVQRIDEDRKTATIHLRHHPRVSPVQLGVFSRVLVGEELDGGDALFIGGRTITLPQRGAARELAEQLARYLSADLTGDVAAGLAARRAALTKIVRSAVALSAEAEIVSEQPPGYPIKDA
jgi:hypothetical protein